MLRIAQVVPYSWSVPGGVRSHVAGLSRTLRALGAEVDILAPADTSPTSPGVLPVGRSVRIHDNGSIVPVALTPEAAVRTARLLRAGRYDLVHLHEPMIPLVCLTALYRAGVPAVGTFHMYAAGPRWYRPFAPLARDALARLAARVAVSEAARRHVASVCPGDYRVIPNGVDVDELAAAGSARSGSSLAFVGRAEPRKGLRVLLEAFRRLPPGVTLDLAGVGEAELRRLLRRARLRLTNEQRSRVRALGYVGERRRARLLGSTDVLCVPSLRGESFGIVLVEGMAAGAAVVASAVVGYVDVLPETCGRLVRPGDPEALAAAVAELLADPGLRERLTANARAEARRYAWPVVARQILEVYAEVLGRPVESLLAPPGRAALPDAAR